MKVLMVTHYFDSHSGGIELVAGELFRRLARPECHVQWAAADVSALPQDGAYASSLPLNTWNGVENTIGIPSPILGPTSLKRLFTAVGASDVVLLHDCLYVSNIAAFLFAKVRAVPVIIVQHIGVIPYSNCFMAKLMKLANSFITKPMLEAADQVAFISQITERYFDELSFAQTPVLVFNGVDTEVFRPPTDDSVKAALRAQFDLPPGGRVALFVGRFVEKKGLHILKKMAARAPGITWAFAGAGPLNPQGWGFAHVRVYSGLRGTNLADLYRASDVFVLPSTGEGFPLVIQEALACGLPVVCSEETATADDALSPFVRGVPLPPGDDEQSAQDFLSATHEVLNKTQSPCAAIDRFRFVQSKYSWAHVAEQYFEIASKQSFGADRSYHQKKRGDESSSLNAESVEAERLGP